ncbi:hypothetical protein HPB48_007546 [Haemaphysalis longicornis]|uniref:Uncharacterized protein n=1 Tax=Haemaphysalis longicornis TaxID=44386 RepID=A0A9J6FE29_HAELO|nr:hypothetical protein HPB48_007546 [Haemaphysalis longicornis]
MEEEEGSSDTSPHSGCGVTERLDATGTAEVPEDSPDPKPSSGSDVTQSLGALTAVVQGSSVNALYSACYEAERPDAARSKDVPEGSSEPPSCTTSSATESLETAGTANVPESAPQWPLRIAGRVHMEGIIGYAHCDLDERDENEEEIRIDDLDVPHLPEKVAKERLDQKQPPLHPSALELVYQMMRHLVPHFTKLHVGQECLGGQLVCVVFRDAETSLLKIQEVVRKDPSMRAFELGKITFMGVLVKLCCLDSPVPRSIGGVLGPDMKWFMEDLGYCDGGSVSTLVKGHPNNKLWESFLDDAAMKIKRVTYSVGVQPPTARGSDAWAVIASSGEPVAAFAAFHEGSFHSSLNASDCLDARHQWISNGTQARANVDGSLLAEVQRSLHEGPERTPPVWVKQRACGRPRND